MARHNVGLFYGFVVRDPIIKKENDFYIQGAMHLCVISGYRKTGDNDEDKVSYSTPVIYTQDSDMIRTMDSLQKNDVVIIKGMISTRAHQKPSQCPHCGGKNIVNGVLTYITPISINLEHRPADQFEAQELISQHREISNTVTLVGYVCNDLNTYRSPRGFQTTEYEIAVNRKFKVDADGSEIRTDYPWIYSYGRIAEADRDMLKIGTNVMVEGAFKTSEFKSTLNCSTCGEAYEWNDFNSEIVAYSTDYLQNYNTPEETEMIHINEIRAREAAANGYSEDDNTEEV